MGLLHAPLALFLRREGRGSPPAAVGESPDLRIAAVAVDLWANVNRPGDRNVIHNHGEPTDSVVASGVYYPEAEAAEAPAAVDGAAGASLRLFVPSGTLELA